MDSMDSPSAPVSKIEWAKNDVINTGDTLKNLKMKCPIENGPIMTFYHNLYPAGTQLVKLDA